MTPLIIIGLLILGLAAGYFSGLVGIGGGIIVVPALVFIFGFSQYAAQGTTLALLIPPIGLLAVWKYYQSGQVDIKTAAIIAVGFVIGSYFGSATAVGISQDTLKKIFAVALVLIGIKTYLSAN
ncbi:MAG: sulfite exporter TauE/SafE family protein [Bacteroidetes bacterium]|nr:sulfite exporter TauE/SafE family protein [Bacteroidota bacterium]